MATPVVLVTGALTGIGRAVAVAYARESANLVVSGRHEDAGVELADELGKLGAQAEFVQADVRRDKDMSQLIDRTVERFGQLDIAVNNAGTAGTPGPVTDITDESYAAVFDTNVLGTLLSMKHEFRAMLPQGGGSIVNVSSTYGVMGFPDATLYVGSKHAVVGITKAAALEGAAHGIRVNAIAPGFTQTALYENFTGGDDTRDAVNSVLPMHRPGKPEEVAAAVLYMGSDKASYLTGQTIVLDGGLTAGWPLFPVG
ncbi:SDR family oxidoreductase [Acrocarpospora corrugata]|uniref:SDR family oxidoreductase n=1 Tax=Acrocarpospora corrugata TaxID=35763 RepID=A0A5M3W5J3_9ACTN|nr:glucose 1-dehydrogenase [Acrocarpospora corrugata]GES03302.1 SDR family oxidoreductase [Acrocarpospora corrugata]